MHKTLKSLYFCASIRDLTKIHEYKCYTIYEPPSLEGERIINFKN